MNMMDVYFDRNNLMANLNENTSSSDNQQDEISSLRDYFKDKIRILSSIGQFSYILKVRADQYDVSLTLQLDGIYYISNEPSKCYVFLSS